MATHDAQGKKEANPVFPWELRFVPNRAGVKNNHTDYYMKQLEGVPANIVLYEVYATDKPTALGGTESHIGSIKLDGKFNSSKFGDDMWFVKHQRMDEDLKHHPEWTPYVNTFPSCKSKGEATCPFKALRNNLNLL